MEQDIDPAAPRTIEDIERLDKALRALLCLCEDLTLDADEPTFLARTLQRVVGALGVSAGFTYVRDGEEFHRVAEAPAGAALIAAEEIVSSAFAERACASGEVESRRLPQGGWLAALPLSSKGKPLGALILIERQGGSRSAPDAALLRGLGRQIGTALDNLRRYAQLRGSSLRSEALNRLMATLTTGLEMKEIIPAFASELSRLESFDRLACGFVNDSGDYIEITTHPEGAQWGLGTVLPVVGSGPGSVVLNGVAVVQPDLLHSHRFIEDMRLLEEGIRSYVLLPLNARGRSIGMLALGSRRGGAYDSTTVERMVPFADSVTLALENMRLFQKTRELSLTDEVTPLFNVRFFHQMLERELKLVDRYKSVLSLLFLDLDKFKPINDRYGHLRGSRVLREVGFLLRAIVRETDYPARYGGDEFVIILPQTDGQAARLLGEKLQRAIESHVFLQEEGINAQLGVSIGMATYPTDVNTKEALIRLADERMYQNKAER